MADDFVLLAGSASRRLGQAIAGYLGHPLGQSETLQFSDGNLFVRVLENVRGRDVFLVQGTAFPVNENLVELLFWIDALKRASASTVTAVIPYFSYAKGDKKDEPRVSIRARVCADAIEAAGVDRVVTLDLHAPQIQGFFKVPVDDLYALPVLCDAVAAKGLENLVVVAPDAGFAKKARQWANRLRAPLAIADKQRVDHSETAEVTELMGSVEGRTALIVDDFTVSAGTLADAARVLVERGGQRREPAGRRRCGNEGRGRLGGGPVRRSDPSHRPPREHQPPVPVAHIWVMIWPMARRQVLVQLDDELVEQLDEIAGKRNVSRSQLLREGGWAVVHLERVQDADAKLREGYLRYPQDPDLMESLDRIAAETMPEW